LGVALLLPIRDFNPTLPVLCLNNGFVRDSAFLEFPVHVDLVWRGFALEGLITLDNQSRNFFLIVDSLKDCLHQNFVSLPSAVALVPRHGTPLICGLHPRGLHLTSFALYSPPYWC
jgi:hypothetical protein